MRGPEKKRSAALAVAVDPDAGAADEGNRAEILAAAAEAFMTNGYAATSIDTGVRWDSAGIRWPFADPLISARDAALPTLEDWRTS